MLLLTEYLYVLACLRAINSRVFCTAVVVVASARVQVSCQMIGRRTWTRKNSAGTHVRGARPPSGLNSRSACSISSTLPLTHALRVHTTVRFSQFCHYIISACTHTNLLQTISTTYFLRADNDNCFMDSGVCVCVCRQYRYNRELLCTTRLIVYSLFTALQERVELGGHFTAQIAPQMTVRAVGVHHVSV